MYVRGSCYATALSLPFAVAAFVFARPLLISWIGPRAEPAVGAARLFALYEGIQAMQNVGSTMIYGIGRIRFPLVINGFATFLNLVLSIALVRPLGFSGVIVGTLIANGLAWPLLLRYYLRIFDCRFRTWLRRVLMPNLPGLLLQIVASLGMYEAVGRHTRSLAVAVLLFLISVAVSLLGFVFVGVRGADRQLLSQTMRRALGRPQQEVSA
jgi:O-antigen/teichoic acid export membrane protein